MVRVGVLVVGVGNNVSVVVPVTHGFYQHVNKVSIYLQSSF